MALTDDEAAYHRIAGELADALVEAIPGWIERVGRARMVSAGIDPAPDAVDGLRSVGRSIASALDASIREVLTADVDAGAGSPLAVLRAGVGPVTELLRGLGVPPVRRDDFAVRNFPDDAYDLAPASFADVDEALHEPGMVWGAARAHVHLRRRSR